MLWKKGFFDEKNPINQKTKNIVDAPRQTILKINKPSQICKFELSFEIQF